MTTSAVGTASASAPVGTLLRQWRERRRRSQLDLSIGADISTRHLSFVETGRSRPTPDMILRLASELDVPLRERNQLLLAGGYAPAYPERALDDPALAGVRQALRLVLAGHDPFPALVLDRWWTLLDANPAVAALVDGCAQHLLEPPVNVLRLSLHPDGLAPRIANLTQWRGHLMSQLRRRIERTGDARLVALDAELRDYPSEDDRVTTEVASPHGVVLPLQVRVGDHELSLFTLSAAVETASDVTVHELVVESFYPADERTAALLRGQA